MKFKIGLASDWTREKKPCDREGLSWNASLNAWTIDISSIEELVSLIEELESIIIHIDSTGLVITVYDDYVE